MVVPVGVLAQKHSKAFFLFFSKPFIFSNSFESIQIGFEFEWFQFDSQT
jgi:hypothetical protein